MKKELLFKNFDTLHIKTPTKTRLFAVLIISFFFQFHLFGAVTKITPKEESLALINTKGSIEVLSYPGDLENIIVTDSTRQTANTLEINLSTQFQENSTKINPSNPVSKGTTDVQEEDDKTIFFISAGTTVVGLDQIYEVKVVSIPEKSQPTEVSKVSFLEQANVALSEKKAKIKLSHLKNKVHKKPDCNFSTSPAGNSGNTQGLAKKQTGVFISYNVLQKHALASTYDIKILKIESQLIKQKFYTSLSYLQFGKYRTSSLRGPPQILNDKFSNITT